MAATMLLSPHEPIGRLLTNPAMATVPHRHVCRFRQSKL